MLRSPVHRARIVSAAVAWSAAVLLAVSPLLTAPATAGTSTDSGSALTVSGTGAYSSLKVTVSQTATLIDQDVRVSWTGGAATPNGFTSDYLQIMQCWSDDPAGPTREQCEFGNSQDTRGGPQVTTRQLDAGSSFTDPLETQQATADNPYNYVPFESASWIPDPDPTRAGHEIHEVVQGDRDDLGRFFDPQSTNEQPLNETGADGTGETYFETMTAEEASGLGCGRASTDDNGQPWTPYCWMVVVPRGETEVNGQPASANDTGLVSTPLSASNWADRILIPLQFTPIGLSCPIGSPERRTSGQEIASEAVFRWQAALCDQSGTVYSYAEVSDDQARRQLLSAAPGMDFLTNPVPTSTSGSADVVYAPLAITAGVIAFNIDYTLYGSDALKPLAGRRVPSINLTPRLVAKLLTQSYRSAAPASDPALANPDNVLGLTWDPDFFSVNPDLTGLDSSVGDVLMPFVPSDITQQLWTWVSSDPDAKAFLDGRPDPWGMTVNPNYLQLTDTSVPDSFPKIDPYCQPRPKDATGSQPANLCTLDDRPYANDMHDAARSASRGDTLSRSTWDPTPPQPHYKKGPLQISGTASAMAFTDAATAARYSLPVAHLENAAGQFVAPSDASMTAGVGAMTAAAGSGVLQPNPEATDPNAYPLTSVAYGATVPGQLSAAARAGYADFVQYAVTAGQNRGADIGQLPDGYVPLTQPLVTSALVASVAIRNYVAPPATSAAAPAPTTSAAVTPKPTPQSTTPAPRHSPAKPTVHPTTKPPVVVVTTSAFPPLPPTIPDHFPAGPTVPPAPVVTPRPALTTDPAPTAPAVTPTAVATAAPASTIAVPAREVAAVSPTPALDAGGGRYVVIVVLAIGGLCALSGPTLLRFGGRRQR